MKRKIVLVALMLFSLQVFSQPFIQWQKSLGGYYDEYGYSIVQTLDGGFAVAGFSLSNDGDVTGHHGSISAHDYWIVKLDSAGVIQWQKSLGGTGSEEANSIQQTVDSGYVIAGYGMSADGDVTGNHGGADYWVVKLDMAGNIQWQKSLGGTADDKANSVQQTSDGGYIVAGESHSNNGDVSFHHGGTSTPDYWIVKLNASGNLQWEKSLGGTLDDVANSIQQTTNGEYIAAGFTNSNDGDITGSHGGAEFWIVKINSVGNLVWQKCLGGSNWEIARSIQQISSGGFIVAGETTSNDGDVSGQHGVAYVDYWVVKIDTSGNLIWQKCLGGAYHDMAKSVEQTSDGGFIIGGYSSSTDGDVTGHHGNILSADYWLVKLNAAGNLSWQKSLGGFEYDYAYSVVQTADAGFALAGWSLSNDGDVTGHHGNATHADYWVVKLSPFISALDISSMTPDSICQTSSVMLHWTLTDSVSIGTYEVQISDSNGNFSSAISLGQFNISTAQSSGTFTTNSIVVPPASCYRLRINRITFPALTGNPGSCLQVVDCAGRIYVANMVPDPVCLNSSLVMSWLLDDTTSIGTYEVEMSDSFGNFSAPVVVSQFNITSPQISGLINISTTNILPGSCYRLRVNRITAPAVTGDSSLCLQVDSCPSYIITHQPAANTDTNAVCIGSVWDITFDAHGYFFFPNAFTAELSDSAGSFSSPTSLGLLVRDTAGNNLIINSTVPNVSPGCNYYIRVTAYGPPTIGTFYGPFCIQQCDINSINPSQDLLLCLFPSTQPLNYNISVDAHSFNNNITYLPGNQFKVQMLSLTMNPLGSSYNFGSVNATNDAQITMHIPPLDTLALLGMSRGNYYFRVNATLCSNMENSLGTLHRLTIGAPRYNPYNIITLDYVTLDTLQQACENQPLYFTTIPPPDSSSTYLWSGSQLPMTPVTNDGWFFLDSTGFEGLLQLQVRENNFGCWGNICPIYYFPSLNCDSTAGVKEIISEPLSFSISPNPCFENLYLNFNNPGWHNIQITDVLGKNLYKTSSNSLALQINTDFPPGIYFITVTDENKSHMCGTVTKKIVKM